jgi:sarcosine oxidase/L-pipecolate oxidase
MVYAEDMSIARRVVEIFKTLCGASPSNIISVEEAKPSFNGIFSDGNWTGVKESYWSPKSGWAEADHALKSVIQAALDHGVSYRESAVQKLIIDKHGNCSGIVAEDGTEMTADHIILCTGARTAQLLASSAPHNKDIQAGGRLVAAGAVSCAARLPVSRRELFQAAPVLFNAMEHTRG